MVEDAADPMPARPYDRVVTLNAADIAPSLTWGTSPEDVVQITVSCPIPTASPIPSKRAAARKSLDYMGLTRALRCAT